MGRTNRTIEECVANINVNVRKELSRQDGQACEPGDLSLALQMAPVQQVPTHASTNEPAEPEASLIVTDRRRKHLRRSGPRGELIGEV